MGGDDNVKYCTGAGIEPTLLTFRASVLTISPRRLTDVTHAYLSMQLLACEVSAHYYTHPPGTLSLLILTIAYGQ